MMKRSLIPFALFPALVSAQNGDKKDTNFTPVVPAEMIPAAPVLSVKEALKGFQIAPGFVIEPIAAEPLVDKPVAIDIDPAGRLWVCEMTGFMPDLDGKGEELPQGKIVVLEDTNGDGVMDKRTVFLDQIVLPRAVSVFPDGVLFIDEHELQWVKRDGLKIVGKPEVVQKGLVGEGNPEHKMNGLMRNLDNWLYNAKSSKRLRRIDGKWVIQSTTDRGQWGITHDDYGRLYANNNSAFLIGEALAPDLLGDNSKANFKISAGVQIGSNNTWPIRVTPGVNRAYQSKKNGYPNDTLNPETFKLTDCTAASGPVIYRGTNFPKEWYGRAFSPEPSVNLLKVIDIQDKDAALKGSHPLGKTEFLATTDERFRPVNTYNSPDGSLMVVDMSHGILQHKFYLTSYLRQQYASRGLDKPATGVGRIYRIRSTSGKLEAKVNFETLTPAAIVPYLGHANGWHRDTAQRELINRADLSVVPALEKLAATSTNPLAQINAMWTLEGLGKLNATTVAWVLKSTQAKAVCSALWASTKLNEAELAKLAPVLIALPSADKETQIYLARALGQIGTPAAYDRLVQLLEADPANASLQAAAVTGLKKHEQEFKTHLKDKLANSKLAGWLDKAIAGPGKANTETQGLSPEHLASFERGKKMYIGEAACFGCHGSKGEGVTSLGPPLDGSEWVTESQERLLKILLRGLTGPITVDGTKYTPTSDMPGLALNPMMDNQKIADIATYIRHEWSNRADQVKPETVDKARKATEAQGTKPYTAAELGK